MSVFFRYCIHLVCPLATRALAVLCLTLPNSSYGSAKIKVAILESQAHDETVFTQGLYMKDQILYESSGLYGRSFLRRYHAKRPHERTQISLPRNRFAEGLTVLDNQIAMLTWRAEELLIYDALTLKQVAKKKYQGEGWGLTHNAEHFIMSNGSSLLTFRNKDTFNVEREIHVHNQWRKYHRLNELEFADGHIWANVWQSPFILKIAPETGKVIGIVDLSDLVAENSVVKGHTVLNGIAYDSERKAFWITGKNWPKRYLIQMLEH